MMPMRPLLLFFLLLVFIPATDAGKLKGLKRSASPEDVGAERNPKITAPTKTARKLKEKGKSKRLKEQRNC
jgi:hypothetical protein